MVHRLRRRVKAALSEIRTLKNEVGFHKTAAEKSQKAEIKYKEQLDRALSKVDQLEENAIDREKTNKHVAYQMLVKVDNVDTECKRLKQLVAKRGSEVVQLEDRLAQTLRMLKEQQEKYKVALSKIQDLQKSEETVTSLREGLESSNKQLLQYKLKCEHQKQRIMRAIELQKSSFDRIGALSQEEVRAKDLAESLQNSKGIIEDVRAANESLRQDLQLKSTEAEVASIRVLQLEKELAVKTNELKEQQILSEDYYSQIQVLQNEFSNAVGNKNLSRTLGMSSNGGSDTNAQQLHRISSLEKHVVQLSNKMKNFRTKCEALAAENKKLFENQRAKKSRDHVEEAIGRQDGVESEIKDTVLLLGNVNGFFPKLFLNCRILCQFILITI